MKICAGIVLYNPDIDRLIENIDSINMQVKEIVLVDNASKNTQEIQDMILSKYPEIVYIRNKINEGIAKALNQILNYSEKNGYEAFLTLDQDSICNSELVEKYLRINCPQIGQISCRIIDRQNGEIDAIDFQGEDVKEIEYCITSGAINFTSAIKDVGGFEEKLFIDGVDLDISLRLKKNGYHVIKVNYAGIIHELGNCKDVADRLIKTSNHVPWRNYYTRRNLIYVARKYYSGRKKIMLICKQVAYGFGAILLEDKKMERVKYNCKGIIHGLSWNVSDHLKK